MKGEQLDRRPDLDYGFSSVPEMLTRRDIELNTRLFQGKNERYQNSRAEIYIGIHFDFQLL